MSRSDGSESIPTPVTDDDGSNNFDGNPNWLSDGSPECSDKTVATKQGMPVTLELECVDTGPEFELSDPNGTVSTDGAPANGTLSDESPLTNPSTVVYTPNLGFTGQDTVVYTAFDAAGFGADTGVVTIDVKAIDAGDGDGGVTGRCAGRKATITGTGGADVLRGTAGPDVIAAGAGRDLVRGGRGADVICGGAGKDRLKGGSGRDRLFGNTGRDGLKGGAGTDRLNGGSGKDRCTGGPGKDRTRRCEKR